MKGVCYKLIWNNGVSPMVYTLSFGPEGEAVGNFLLPIRWNVVGQKYAAARQQWAIMKKQENVHYLIYVCSVPVFCL